MAYDKVVDSAQLNAAMTATADAIRGKTGGANGIAWDALTGFAEAVEGIEAGGRAHVEEKDVNFYDYDGTLLHSYTLAEAQALTELPPLPVQKGLVCQGWNWTLEQLQKYPLPIDVGAMYITDDGATRLTFHFMSENTTSVYITFSQSKEYGTRVEWGDGSAVETFAGTGYITATHKYSLGGYTASFLPDEDCTIGFAKGSGGSDENLLGTAADAKQSFGSVLTGIYFGKNTESVRAACFRKMRALKHVTIPTNIKTIGWNAFDSCNSIAFVVVPNSVTYVYPQSFKDCYSLTNVLFPGVKVKRGSSDIFPASTALRKILFIDNNSLYERIGYTLYSLNTCVFWDNVSEINKGFAIATGAAVEMYVLSAAPPVLSSGAFSSIAEGSVIHIRKGTLEMYQNDTNWVAVADFMEELPW